MIGGGIDLSVGSVLLIAGIVVDESIRLAGLNAAIAALAALVVGGIAGLINGVAVTRCAFRLSS